MTGPRKSFRTEKGTELPLLNLKGREYLQVMHRLVWFRERYPTGIIKTQLIDRGGQDKNEYAVFRAEIYVDTGSAQGPIMVSSGHKKETAGGFADYLEKAESGAVGRALAMMGIGTQFCSDELDEGNRLADSPAPVLEKTITQEQVTQVMTTDSSTPRRGSFRKNVTKVDAAVGDDL